MPITGMPAARADWIEFFSASPSGDRHDDAVRIAGDGGVDHLAHRRHVEDVGRLVLDVGVEVLAGLGEAILDGVPVGIAGLPVGDEDHAELLVLRLASRRPEREAHGHGDSEQDQQNSSHVPLLPA